MVFETIIFSYILRRCRERKKRHKKRTAPEGSVDDVDGVDGDTNEDSHEKRTVINKILMVWGFIECFSLIWVILRMAAREKLKGYPGNFMNELCPAHKCDSTIIRIIAYKLFSSVALVAGARFKLTLPMLPWFVINVLGIFPFSLVVASALYDFSDYEETYNELWFYQHFLS